MPFRHLPNSDAQRLAALAGANKKWLNTTNAADRLITAEQFAQLDLTNPASTYSVFKRDVGEASAALSKQTDITDDHTVAAGSLGQIISHFIQVFNFGVARGIFTRSDRAFYGLDVSRSDVPVINTYSDFALWAGKVVDGEAARQQAATAAGTPFFPMAMPSAAEVADALALVEEIRGRQSGAKDSYNKEQSDVETDRPAVDALIADVWDTIEFNLRKQDGSSRRRRAREWGVVYLTRPDETPDPDAPTQPNENKTGEGGISDSGGTATPLS